MNVEHLRVLVVEDHPGQRELLRHMVESLGVSTVAEAECGRQAISMLNGDDGADMPDLVITDLNMRDGDGFDVLRRAAQCPRPPQVIVVSAVEQDVLAAVEHLELRGEGMHISTIAKPVCLDRLRAVIAEAADQHPARSAASMTLADIARGIEAGEFVPFLEPKVDLRSGCVVGFEVLARWRHPLHGLLPPSSFIPAIEASPLMQRFTLALFDRALDTRVALQAAGYAGSLALNFGAGCLGDRGFPAAMLERLRTHGLADGRGIVLELTETAGVGSTVDAVSGLGRLRLLGFELAIDDFGIGHASLANMQNGAFSEIKIDRQFSSRVESDRLSRAAIESIITIAASLGWRCVAEGIETEGMRAALCAMGCTTGQGYLFARPIDPNDIIAWWRRCDGRPAAPMPGTASAPTIRSSGLPSPRLDAMRAAMLARSATPSWLFDLEQPAIVWANDAALAFWHADSHGQLYSRDFHSDLSSSARERLQTYGMRLAAGKSVSERWTLYPLGVPTAVDCELSGILTDAGHAAMLVEAHPRGTLIADTSFEAESAIASSVAMMMLDGSGRILWQNPAALHEFGSSILRLDEIIEPAVPAQRLLEQTLAAGSLVRDARLQTLDRVLWHRLQLRTSRDPSSGERIIVCCLVPIDDLVAR